MSFADGAPGVTITEQDESFYVSGAATSVGGMLGVANWGPVNTPTLVTSWPAFQRLFGDYLSGYYLAYAVKMHFDEGGGPIYISRITTTTAGESDAVQSEVTLQTTGGGATQARETGTVAGVTFDSALTWAMASGNKLSFKVDAAGKVTVTISATAATKNLTNSATFTLTNGWTILYRVGAATEPVRTIVLDTADFVDISNATAAEVQAVLARDMLGVRITRVTNQVTLTTDQRGSGARLEFTGGTALTALGLSVQVLTGSGNVADVDHVTATELDTLCVAADANVTFAADDDDLPYLEHITSGSGHSVQFVTDDADETAGAAVFGFDTTLHSGTSNTPIDTLTIKGKYPGTRGDDITIDSANATVNSSTRFKLTVKYLGVAVETQDELSMDPDDDRYVGVVFADSAWIAVEDEDAFSTTASYTTARPAVASGSALAGGDDGLSGLASSDFSGSSTYHTGLYAFDPVTDIAHLGAPGYTDRTFAALLLAYCEARLDVLSVLDMPYNLSVSVAKEYRYATGAYVGGSSFDSSYAALYHPWLKVTDPLTNLPTYIPPMGAVFAAYATTDANENVWRAPAGPTRGKIRTAEGLKVELGQTDVGQLYAAGINVLINHRTHGIIIDGQKTLQAVPSDYDRIKIRRGAIYIRRSLVPTVERVAEFEPNDEVTWTRLKAAVAPFLTDQVTARGIAQYRLVCDATTNTPSVVTQNRLVAKLYVKYTKDAEFVEISLVNVAQSVDLAA